MVLWACPAQDQLILQDDTGGIRVEIKLRGQPGVHTGDHVRLEGSGIAGFGRLREVLVDNDGLHGTVERSESIYLPVGRHPIRLAWFNGPGPFGLEVDYEGPGLARQPIPDAALFRAAVGPNGTTRLVHGLDYRCYQGNWDRLPDFDSLPAVKAGTTTNFDLSVRSRDQAVGLQFTGYLELPQEGRYTFWSKSDDGSRLFIGESVLRLSPLGPAAMPPPRPIKPGQLLSEAEECQWAQAEGTVTFVHGDPSGGLEVQLGAGTNCLYLDVDDAVSGAPAPFSRIRATGVCCSPGSSGGQRAAPRLIVPGLRHIEVLASPLSSARPTPTPVAQLRRLAASRPRAVYGACLEGVVLSADPERGLLAFQDDSAAALVELPSQRQDILARTADHPRGQLGGGRTAAEPAQRAVSGQRRPPWHDATVRRDLPRGRQASDLSFLVQPGPPLGLEIYYEDGTAAERCPTRPCSRAD